MLLHNRQNKLGGYDYKLNCQDCFRGGKRDTNIDPVFDETTRHIVIAVSVLSPLLYMFGLIFSLNSHYRLIEEEEHMIQESLEMGIESELKAPPRVEVGMTIGIHDRFLDVDRERIESISPEMGEDQDTSEREERTKAVVVRCSGVL